MVGRGRTQRTDGRMVRRTADGHGGWSGGRTDGWIAGRTEQRTDVAAGRTDGRTNERTRMFFFARTDGWMIGRGRMQRTDGRMVRRTADGHGGWSDGRTDGWMPGLTEQRTNVAEGRTDVRTNGQTGMIEQKCVSFYSAGIDQAKRCEFLQCQHSAGTVPAQCRQQCRQQCRHGKYSTF